MVRSAVEGGKAHTVLDPCRTAFRRDVRRDTGPRPLVEPPARTRPGTPAVVRPSSDPARRSSAWPSLRNLRDAHGRACPRTGPPRAPRREAHSSHSASKREASSACARSRRCARILLRTRLHGKSDAVRSDAVGPKRSCPAVPSSGGLGEQDAAVHQEHFLTVTQVRWIGTRKLRFSPPPERRTPTMLPWLSTAGPPEFPGLAAASVWIWL